MPYQALFSLCILSSLALIIFGWRSADSSPVYDSSPALGIIALILMFLSFTLMVGANFPTTRIKRFIRHPQLSGVLLWAIAHLLTNGDSRSLVLFSALGLWSVVSMVTINRRDGDWQKPKTFTPIYMEAIPVIIGVCLAFLTIWLHVYLSGVSLMGT
jgi:uncharacterized membrane protein